MDIYYCVNFIKNKLLPFDSAGRISTVLRFFHQLRNWIAGIAAGFIFIECLPFLRHVQHHALGLQAGKLKMP